MIESRADGVGQVGDLVHKGIVELIYRVIEKLDPSITNNYKNIFKRINEPGETLCNSDKIALLKAGYERFGIALFHEVGNSLVQNPTSPLVFFLLNSESPSQLISKLQCYDSYFHSSRRVKLLLSGDNHLIVEHYCRQGKKPHLVEELFVFYTVKALLSAMGCKNVIGNWAELYNNSNLLNLGVTPETSGFPKSEIFEYAWDKITRPKKILGLDEFLLSSTLPTMQSTECISMREKIETLVRKNISDKWPLADIANKLSVSPRTLQRRLKNEGISYCQVVLDARIKHAYQLLIYTDYQITEIGLMCGFSDGAHFSREFKRAVGCVPSKYRHKRHSSRYFASDMLYGHAVLN